MITIDVHARDIVTGMVEHQVVLTACKVVELSSIPTRLFEDSNSAILNFRTFQKIQDKMPKVRVGWQTRQRLKHFSLGNLEINSWSDMTCEVLVGQGKWRMLLLRH